MFYLDERMQGATWSPQTVVKNSCASWLGRGVRCSPLSTSSRGSVNYHLSRATPLRNQFLSSALLLLSRPEFQNFSWLPSSSASSEPLPSSSSSSSSSRPSLSTRGHALNLREGETQRERACCEVSPSGLYQINPAAPVPLISN